MAHRYGILVTYLALPDFKLKLDVMETKIEEKDVEGIEEILSYIDRRLRKMRAVMNVGQISTQVEGIDF